MASAEQLPVASTFAPNVRLRLCAMTFFVILPHQNAMSMLVSYQKIQANFFNMQKL